LKQDVHIFGPLPSRKAAGDYISALNEAFWLCRQQCLIDDPAKAASCPYYQMGTCDAPCLGKASREMYLCRIKHAIEAAGGSRQEHAKWFNDTMKTLAAQMNFEEAQRTKKQLEHLKKLDDPTYRWVCDLRELNVLHIDAGPKIKIKGQKKKTQSYMVFLIQGGAITQLENFITEQISQLLETVSATINRLACETSAQNIAEQMALTGFAMYRSKPSGLWINCRKLPTADEMANIISKKFVDNGAGSEKNIGSHQ
jgi:excinuclease UvrABC nuclease subunit